MLLIQVVVRFRLGCWYKHKDNWLEGFKWKPYKWKKGKNNYGFSFLILLSCEPYLLCCCLRDGLLTWWHITIRAIMSAGWFMAKTHIIIVQNKLFTILTRGTSRFHILKLGFYVCFFGLKHVSLLFTTAQKHFLLQQGENLLILSSKGQYGANMEFLRHNFLCCHIISWI